MQLLTKKNPTIYLSETTQYIKDLQELTLLRDKCQNLEEKNAYSATIHCMQEVLIFMNSINKKDRAKLKTQKISLV